MRNLLYYLIAMIILNLNIYTSDRQFSIYDAKTGLKIDMVSFAEKSQDYDIVFFGEFHDDSLIHSIQHEYLSELVKKGKFAISLEMFERDVQKQIDKYLKGIISEEEFLKNSRPWYDYKKYYKPLIEIAKTNLLPVIASNIPRKYASLYINEGMVSINKLAKEEREYISKTIKIEDDEYFKSFKTTMLENFGLSLDYDLSPNQENNLYLYYGAQVLKDETMAESIIDFISKNKEYKIIHFNGDFHSNKYLGTVQKVIERNKDLKIAVITPNYVSAGIEPSFDTEFKNKCDFLVVLQDFPRETMSKTMMGGHLSENFASKHKIEVYLEPSRNEIEGLDIIQFKYPIIKSCQLTYLGDLIITKVTNNGKDLIYKVEPIKDDSLYSSIIIYPGNEEIKEINVEYKGKIYHSPLSTSLNQRHSNCLGIISDTNGEGIYLPGGSYYPKTFKDFADFDIKAIVPNGISIITSGLMQYMNPIGDKTMFHYVSELPADEFTLVGGRYKQIDTIYNGKTFSVYTFEESRNSLKYLTSIVEYYKIYNRLLGTYPYSSFKIVENFFATGFGMPGYTLLSNKLMAMPWIVLNPGSLIHEFVHNWWGNSVFVNYEFGNWCEALTTFCSNYYFNVYSKRKKDEIDWRKKALISLESLPQEKNYPLIEFKYQNNYDDATIGYSKGGFLFYEVYKFFGDENFFEALRSFHSLNKGKKATWMNIIAAFSMTNKKNNLDFPVSKIFDQWLRKVNIPTLKLENVKFHKDTLNFEINQDSSYIMRVPVEFDIDDQKTVEYFTINEMKNSFTKIINGRLKSIQVDPYYECLRKLNRWEIPFSFSRTLADNPLMILPSKKSQDYEEALKFAKMIIESNYKIDYTSVDKIKDKDWMNRSIIIIGSSKSNSFFHNLVLNLQNDLQISDTTLNINKSKFEVKGNLLLLNVEHPQKDDKYLSIIYTDKLDSQDALKRLFRYLHYSLVLINKSKTSMPLTQMEIFPKKVEKKELFFLNQ